MSAETPRCTAEGHCVTCSDEGIPMRVLTAGSEPGLALCRDAAGRAHEVLIDLVGEVQYGDEVLVHAGVALLLLPQRTLEATPPKPAYPIRFAPVRRAGREAASK